MMTPQPPPPEKPAAVGGLAGIVMQVSGAIQSWRQLIILIVVGVAVLVGLIVFETRARLVNAIGSFMVEPADVQLVDQATAQRAVTDLLDQVAPAVGVLLWQVDLLHNRRTLWALKLAPQLAEPLRDIRPGRVAPLFRRGKDYDNQIAVHVLDGEASCGPPPRAFWEAMKAPPEAAGLIAEVCAVGIPSSTEALVGMLSVGFGAQLDPWRESTVLTTIRTVADTLAVK